MRTSASNTEGPSLVMRRGPAPLPALELPPGIRLRTYADGGAAAWEHIVNTAFERDNMSFEDIMRSKGAFRPERIQYLEREGSPVAVAAAWQRDKWPPGTGYLHYVAVLPEARGMRLGYWVSLAALHQMRREGNTHALLETQDHRLPAIKTYFKLGFAPDLTGHESYPERWERILEQIRW